MGNANTQKMNFVEYVKSFFSWNFVIMLLIFISSGFANRLLTAPTTTFSVALGISGTVLGLLTSLQKVVQMCSRPFSAWVFDQLSGKRMLLISYLLMALSCFLYAITGNQVLFSIAKLFQGFAAGMLGGLAYSMLVKSMGIGSFGMAVAVISAIQNVFVGYAPVLSKNLFENVSFFAAYAVAAVCYLIPAALCLLLKKDDKASVQAQAAASAKGKAEETDKGTQAAESKKKKGVASLLKGIDFAILPVCTLGLFANCTRDLYNYYTVQLGQETGIDTTVGMALAAVVTVWVGFVVGFFIDRLNAEVVLVASYALLAACNLAYGMGTNLTTYNMAAIFYQIGIAAYWPALQAVCFKTAGKGREGAASQTLYMFLDLVGIVFASLVGVLYDAMGLKNVYVFFGGVNLFAVVYFLVLKKAFLDKYIAKRQAQQ